MACSKYTSTKETTHAARLSRLLLDPCTDLFRDLLRTFITEVQFPYALQNFRNTLNPIFNKDHRNLLYPNSGQFLGTYAEFDLSLLYILLRNISGITSHKNGWGKQPDVTDRSLSANIDRIREIRNTYCGHVPRVALADKDFQKIWQDMTVIIRELEGSLPAGCTKYTDAAKQLKTVSMDPELEKKYLDIIDKQHKVWDDIKDTATGIIKEQNKLHQEHQHLRAEQNILKSGLEQQGHEFRSHLQRQETKLTNEQEKQDKELKYALHKQETELKYGQQRLDREFKSALQKQGKELKLEIQRQSLELNAEQQTQKTGLEVVTNRLSVFENYPDCERRNILDNTAAILKSIKSRDVYIRTSAVDRIIEKLKENQIVILTGKAGTGKTTTAYHVMCELSDESLESPYIPVIINSPDEWNKVVNHNHRYIVFIDDFMGSTNLDRVAVDKWKSKLDTIFACTRNGQVFALIGIRRNVLDEAERYHMHGIFHEVTIFDLSMEQNITTGDKKKMFEAYNAKSSFKDSMKFPHYEREQIACSDPYYGFPLTCFQFFSRMEFYQLGPSFFLHPNEKLYHAIEGMRKSKSECNEKLSYCILCYVFMQGNIMKNAISYDLFDGICKKVRINRVSEIDIWDAIDDLNGMYLSDIKTKSIYQFSHETVLETVLLSFGQLAPNIVIKRCRKKIFDELIRTENYETKPGEVVLKIPPSHFEDLAQRMLRGDDGDGVEDEKLENIVDVILQHPACQDSEFVYVLLNRNISVRMASILSLLCKSFPLYCMHEVLRENLLEYYGPHFMTSESLQTYVYTIGKIYKRKRSSLDVELCTPIVLTETKLFSPFFPVHVLHYVIQQKFNKPFIITRHDLADLLTRCVTNFRNKSLAMMLLQYIKKYPDLHDLLGNLYVVRLYDKYFPNSIDPLNGYYKETPLHCCVTHGWEDMVDIILNIHKPSKTTNNWTCVHFAAYNGRWTLLERFINLGQDITERTAEGYSALQIVLLGLRYGSRVVSTRSYVVPTSFSDGYFWEYCVSMPGSDEFENVIRILLKNKTHCFASDLLMEIDKFRNGIGHYLVIHNYSSILDLLLECNKKFAFLRNNSELPTTLHVAVYLGRPKLVRTLWEAGVRPDESDPSLVDILDDGKKFCTRKMEYSYICIHNRLKTLWNENGEEIMGIKLKCIALVGVEFGNDDAFQSVRHFLQDRAYF